MYNYLSDSQLKLGAGLYDSIYKQHPMTGPHPLDMRIPAGKMGWCKPYYVVYKDYDGKIRTGWAWSKALAFLTYQDITVRIPIYPGAKRLDNEPIRKVLYLFKVSVTNLHNFYKQYPR